MSKAARSIGGASQGAASGFAIGGPVGAIVGGGIGLLGGLFGGESEEAKVARENAAKIEKDWALASPAERQVMLGYLQEMGQLSPEMEQAILQGPSEVENIVQDPSLRKAQMDSLARLEQKVAGGGFDLEDQARMLEAQRSAARDARGRQEAILANMAQRGMAGAGQELAAQLASSQAAADQQAQQQLNIAAEANRRAAQNIQDKFNMARGISQDEYSQGLNRADRMDAINRFNVGTQQGVQQRNVASRNQAQQSELDYRRGLAATNLNIANQQRMDDRAQRSAFAEDRNRKLLAQTGQAQAAARAQDAAQQAATQGWSDALEGVGTVAVKGMELQDKRANSSKKVV